jgi:hypothetical protein
LITTLVFVKNANYFARRKLAKIAEKCNHNIVMIVYVAKFSYFQLYDQKIQHTQSHVSMGMQTVSRHSWLS